MQHLMIADLEMWHNKTEIYAYRNDIDMNMNKFWIVQSRIEKTKLCKFNRRKNKKRGK